MKIPSAARRVLFAGEMVLYTPILKLSTAFMLLQEEDIDGQLMLRDERRVPLSNNLFCSSYTALASDGREGHLTLYWRLDNQGQIVYALNSHLVIKGAVR